MSYTLQETEDALELLVAERKSIDDAVVDCEMALSQLTSLDRMALLLVTQGVNVEEAFYTEALKHLNARMNNEDSPTRPDVLGKDQAGQGTRKLTRIYPSQLHRLPKRTRRPRTKRNREDGRRRDDQAEQGNLQSLFARFGNPGRVR
jgi:hypothetical protein